MARIQDAEGQSLVLKLMPDRRIGFEAYAEEAAPWGIAAVPAPEQRWHQSRDAWMRRAADEQLARGSSIGHASRWVSSRGCWRRLPAVPGRSWPSSGAGRPDPASRGPEGLGTFAHPDAQLASLEELALTHADRWHTRLEAAASAPSPEDPSWQSGGPRGVSRPRRP